MKKKLQILITALALFLLNVSYAQVHSWVGKLTHANWVYGTAMPGDYKPVATDHLGNTYVFFACGNTIFDWNFGDGVVINNVVGGRALAKYDVNGVCQWAKLIEGYMGAIDYWGEHYTRAGLDVDAAGYIYVTGNFRSETLDFGAGITLVSNQFPANTESNVFVAKYDANGNCLWASMEETLGRSLSGQDIAVCPNGDLYVLSNLIETTGMGMESNAFISKYNSSGTQQWLQPLPTSTGYNGWGYAIDNDTLNNAYVFARMDFFTGSTNDNGIYKYGPAGGSHINMIPGILRSYSYTYDTEPYKLTFEEGVDIAVDPSGNDIYWVSSIGHTTANVLVFGPPTTLTSFGNDSYLAKFNMSSSTLTWVKQIGAGSSTSNIEVANALKLDSHGNVYVGGWSQGGSTSFGPGVTLAGSYYVNPWIAKYSNTGTIQSALGGPLARGKIFDLAVNSVCGMSFAGASPGSSLFTNDLVPISSAIVGLVDMTIATGTIYRDFNNNGSREAGETGMKGVVVEASPGPSNAVSNSSGNYVDGLGLGSYTLTIPTLPLYHTLTTASSHTATFPTCSVSDTANHFGLYPTPGVNDLKITMTPLMTANTGFHSTYTITYKNVGTTTLSGSVQLTHDPYFTFTLAVPAEASYSSGTLTWNYSSLAPGVSANITVYLELSTSAVMGTVINSTASITPAGGDMAPSDNTYTLTETVVSSFDPNDKQVEPAGYITPAQVAAGQWLTYTVRFQNTGTASAINVYVRDTLSNNVDVSSFEVLSSSHTMITDMFDDGIVNFLFNNIMLPDSNSNEPASHGFIKYRVKVNSSVTVGNTIENTAHIYFDFNPAVVTNTTATPVTMPTSIQESAEGSIMLHPNPSSSSINIRTGDINVSKIIVYDMQGRLIQEYLPAGSDFFTDQAELDVHKFSPGSYLLQFITEDQGNLSSRITIIR